MDSLLTVMKRAAKASVAAIVQQRQLGLEIQEKSYRDYVTSSDLASEAQIIHVLKRAYPNSAVCSEEAGYIAGHGYLWIIDPIDGTHNFMYGLPYYGISIAAAQDGEIVAGLIAVPETHELFYASRGGGAYLNGKRIAVSSRSDLNRAMVAYDNQFHKNYLMLENLPKLAQACLTIRILGAASVDLCNIAQGILDARIFHETKLVDFAAGALIVEEAGGMVTNFTGRPYTLETTDIIASNGRVHKVLVELLGK